MLKRIVSTVIAITIVMGMAACSQQNDNGSKNKSAQSASFVLADDVAQPTANIEFKKADTSDSSEFDKGFISSVNGFSVELFKRTAKQELENNSNFLISPESCAIALGMTANGAKGETAEQMKKVLYADTDIGTFNKNFNLILSGIQSDSYRQLRSANSVWVKDVQGKDLTAKFTNTCKEVYNAELFRAPFNDKTVEQINSWVNDKTDKMIPEIIKELSEDDKALLVNCLAFDAKWAKEFEESDTQKGASFTKADGSVVKCDMMSGTAKKYIRDADTTGFIKDYAGGRYAFMALLPNEGTSLSDHIGSLTAEKFTKLYENRLTNEEISVYMPRFKSDYSATLNKTLTDMGIKDAFLDESADFSDMSSDYKLHISKVIHKTHIEVTEGGTKAEAATAVEMTDSAAPPADQTKVVLDRPFAYAIMDTQTGLPVFMGAVCDPSAG